MNRFSSLQIVACALLLSFTLSQSVRAQGFNAATSLKQLNINASFENGAMGWGIRNIQYAFLTRDWTDNGDFPFERYADLDSKLLRLRGAGTWGRTVNLNAGAKYNVLNVHAFRKATHGRGNGGMAFAQVQYFNSDGTEISTVSVPISARDTNKNRGIGDGLVFHALDISVPANARTARLSIVGAANTDVFVDSFRLFSSYNVPASKFIAAPNLVLNHDLRTVLDVDANFNYAQGYGDEFWESYLDWSGLTTEFGSVNQPEYVYQFIPVEGGKTYTMMIQYVDYLEPTGSYGIDYYDANWQRIGGLFAMANDVAVRYHRLEVPAETAYASVWVYADQLEPGQFPVFFTKMAVQLQAPTINTATSIMLSDVQLRGGRGGTRGTGFSVIYSDSDGIDATSIDAQDAYFTSRTIQGRTYPAQIYGDVAPVDNDRIVEVEYLIAAPNHDDFGSLVIRGGQVKDKLGNFAPGRTFSRR